MTTLIRCDRCGRTLPKPGRQPSGWGTRALYKNVPGGNRKVFRGMQDYCPSCPVDIDRPPMEEQLPVLTEGEALLEIEEAARFALLDKDELGGASRKLLERAIAILDAARTRTGG